MKTENHLIQCLSINQQNGQSTAVAQYTVDPKGLLCTDFHGDVELGITYRVTICPLFPGRVLFLDLQKCILPGFINGPKCPGFGCFLDPAPAEFLIIAACSHNMCLAPAI